MSQKFILKKPLNSVYLQGYNINKKQPEPIFPMKTIYVFERKRNYWFKKKEKGIMKNSIS